MAKPTELEKQNIKRAALRKQIKQALDVLEAELAKEEPDIEIVSDNVAQVSSRETKVSKLNQVIFDLMDDTDELMVEVEEVELFNERMTLWKDRARRWVETNANGSSAGSAKGSIYGSTTSIDTIKDTDAEDKQKKSTESSSGKSASKSKVKLPKLQMKKFSGNIEEWQRFWSHFNGTVNQDLDLSDSDKLIYLREYLDGPAGKAIEGLSICAESYKLAIDILQKRFGRNELIISARLNNILKLKQVQKSSHVVELRALHESCSIEVRSLQSLNVMTDSYGELLAHMLGGLLPIDLLEEFSKDKEEEYSWKIDELLLFLENKIRCKERALAIHRPVANSQAKPTSFTQSEKPSIKFNNQKSYPPSAAALNAHVSSNRCVFCEEAHPFYSCFKLPVSERKKIALAKRLCFLCLRGRHQASECNGFIKKCRKCDRKHHQILCGNREEKSNDPEAKPIEVKTPSPLENTASLVAECKMPENKEILLQTARAIVVGPKGESIEVRCLFDGGSQRSFLREDLSRKLNLEQIGAETLKIHPFAADTPIVASKRKVKLVLKNIRNNESAEICAVEIPKVCGAVFTVPSGEVVVEMNKRGLILADQYNSHKPGGTKIDILIGADMFWRVARNNFVHLAEDLVAMDTKLGWTLQGPSTVSTLAINVGTVTVMKVAVSSPTEDELLSKKVQDFWNLESIGITDSAESDEGHGCRVIQNFQDNIRFRDGRYEVAFPWKDNVQFLGNNYEIAKRRTMSLVDKLKRNPATFQAYNEVIKEQLKSGIVELVPQRKEDTPIGPLYYIPHRAVIREDSLTTKLRIVYDASSHAKNVPSLNECIESGPNLLPELFQILVRFRERKIAITGDIAKAFHTIAIAEKDRDSLRFLWVEGVEAPMQEKLVAYRMTRVPFGVTASPFLLNATIKYHAQKVEASHPLASQVLKNDLYVDDLISNCHTVSEGDKLICDTMKVLKDAGMCLRKFRSNSEQLRLKWASQPDGQEQTASLSPAPLKVLGMVWDENSDVLKFDVSSILQFVKARQNTKRWVLKAVARIFDPLGLLAPFVVRAKFLFQETWNEKLSWDKQLPLDITQKFDNWCLELPNLAKIRIPRFYYFSESDEPPVSIELHGFVDASEKAYAAVFFKKCFYEWCN